MKILKTLYLGMAMAAAVSVSSCQADMDAPALVEPKATMEANTTISEFKTAFADKTVLCPMKDEATQTPYIIHGRVVSSDATGNIYKSIVIQDETAAIALSVNQGSTYTDYRIGQDVVVNATGLYIGYYNGLQQLGWYDLYEGAPSLTFMPWDIFLAHSELNGFPNNDVKYVAQDAAWPSENPYCIVTTFSLPTTGEDFRNMQSQLVEFRNVHFEEGGKETYAPYQESVNRTLVDASGAKLTVRTSGYSNFYNEIIPEGTGNVRGILSYYGDGWQLLLRGLGDVMITKKGQKDDPYTIAEAMEVMDQGAAGWVTGYIVGSVKAGVNDVQSNDDVIFGADAEMDNNILIAASADETDWSKCLAVELPQGSAFRASVNLVDNPGVLKKAILVNGNLATFLGMPGITGNGGTANDVEVDGVTIGGGDNPNPGGEAIPAGNGTQEKPYNADQVKTASPGTGMWMEGYVVGYSPNTKWAETVFGNTPTEGSTNYTNATNVTLSMVPVGSATLDNSVPVGLKNTGDVRATLGISKNPAIYGARVKVKGEITSYFGMTSMKNVEEYVIVSGGGDTPTPPEPSGSTIYESLSSDATGWNMNDALAPSGLDRVWSWDSQYKNLKGTAFKGQVYAADVICESPEIDLSGVTNAELTFEYLFNQYKKNNEMINVADFKGYAYVMIRESGAANWNELSELKAESFGWSAWSNGSYSLKNYAGKKVQIGFRYVSTTEVAGTWEVRNLKITGSK